MNQNLSYTHIFLDYQYLPVSMVPEESLSSVPILATFFGNNLGDFFKCFSESLASGARKVRFFSIKYHLCQLIVMH